MNQVSRSEKKKIVDAYLKTHDPSQPVFIGFSIPDAFRYAEKAGKNINELSPEELQLFSTKKNSNVDSDLDDVDEELANFLNYLKSGKPADDFTLELDKSVRYARTNKDWKEEYRDMNMQRRVWEQNARNEGRNEGLTEGQDRVIRLIGHLSKDGRVSDILRASEDPAYLKVLLDEYEEK